MKKLAIFVSGLSLLLINGTAMAQTTAPNIPEPSLLSLLGIGAVGLIAMRLRKRK